MGGLVTGSSGAIAPKKEHVASYVHDAAELECAIFTLDRSIEACEESIKDVVSNAESSVRYARERINDNKAEIEKLRARLKIHENIKYGKYFRKYMIIGLAITFGFSVLAIFAFSLMEIESSGQMLSPLLVIQGTWPLLLMYAILGIIITLIVAIKKGKSEDDLVRSTKKSYTSSIKLQEKRLEESKHKYTLSQKELEESKNYCALMRAHIDESKRQLNELIGKRNAFYAIGVIPPDYRTMDCVLILDQIFRNDLADTMREAIKIYEERVFRGEVIRGMDRICSMLGNLAAGMAVISDRLDRIDMNVSSMNQDLYSLSSRIARSESRREEATAKLIEETKLHRYAAEKLSDTTEQLLRYERYRSSGIL